MFYYYWNSKVCNKPFNNPKAKKLLNANIRMLWTRLWLTHNNLLTDPPNEVQVRKTLRVFFSSWYKHLFAIHCLIYGCNPSNVKRLYSTFFSFYKCVHSSYVVIIIDVQHYKVGKGIFYLLRQIIFRKNICSRLILGFVNTV